MAPLLKGDRHTLAKRAGPAAWDGHRAVWASRGQRAFLTAVTPTPER